LFSKNFRLVPKVEDFACKNKMKIDFWKFFYGGYSKIRKVYKQGQFPTWQLTAEASHFKELTANK
jgi:hypothetical protein